MLRQGCIAAGATRFRYPGIRQSYVSEVLMGHRPPGGQILTALGLERVVRYRIAKDRADGEPSDARKRGQHRKRARHGQDEHAKHGHPLAVEAVAEIGHDATDSQPEIVSHAKQAPAAALFQN